MSLFSNKKSSTTKDETVKGEDVDKKDKKTITEAVYGSKGLAKHGVLLSPWITEKSYDLISESKYVFKVNLRASKREVKREVEMAYDVSVENVNIIRMHSEKRRFGRHFGSRSGYKKAIVTLKKGDSLGIFEGA